MSECEKCPYCDGVYFDGRKVFCSLFQMFLTPRKYCRRKEDVGS